MKTPHRPEEFFKAIGVFEQLSVAWSAHDFSNYTTKFDKRRVKYRRACCRRIFIVGHPNCAVGNAVQLRKSSYATTAFHCYFSILRIHVRAVNKRIIPKKVVLIRGIVAPSATWTAPPLFAVILEVAIDTFNNFGRTSRVDSSSVS